MNVYVARAAFRAKSGRHTVGFVYWKIGRAVNVERAKSVLQTVSPIPVEIVGVLPCDKAQALQVERELKDYLADAQVSGGWYSMNTRQILAVHSLIENWPTTASVRSYLEKLPKRIDCEAAILRVQAEFVPHAALHEARLQIKQLRNEVLEAHGLVQKSALTYKQMFDSAIEVLTQKYNHAIQALQFRALH